jgi:hypothetical protein
MADDDQVIEAPEVDESPEPDQSSSGQPPVAAAPMAPPAQPQGPPIQVVAAHPKANLFHNLLNALGGGDQTQYSVDPQTGAMSVTRVPQTSGQLAKGILAGALTGMFAGAGERGPGSEGRSAAAGFAAAQQQRNAVQAQNQAMAKEDFERQQQAKVRQAQIMKANFDAMKSAYAIGKENDEQKDKIVSNHADDLAQWANTGAVKDKDVPSDQLMKKGYDPSKYIAVPDGKVAVFKPDGSRATDENGVPLSQLTYSVIDGTTQAPLTQEKYDKMVKYGLQKQGSSTQIPEGATVSSAVLAQMNHRMDLVDQTQNEIDKAIGPGKVNVVDKIKENPGLLPAIEAYHNDGSSTEIDNQINNLQAKNPQAAGLMRSLVGKDELEGLKEKREDRIAAGKAAATETARINAEEGTPTGKAKAKKESQQLTNEQLEGQIKQLDLAKKKAEAAPANTQHGPLENGIDNTYINSLPSEKQNAVRLIGKGTIPYTAQALRTSVGQNYLEILANAFPGDATHPGFDASRFPIYEKTRMGFTSGKEAQGTRAFSTAMEHLKEANDNISALSTIGGLKDLTQIGAFGSSARQQANRLNVAKDAVGEELAKAYKAGVADKNEVEGWKDKLNTNVPSKLKDNIQEVARLLKGQFDSLQSQWDNGSPPGMVSPLNNLISPQAQKAYKGIIGQDIGYGTSAGSAQNPPAAPQSHTFSLSAWQKANPTGDANAAKAAAQAQGYQVTN